MKYFKNTLLVLGVLTFMWACSSDEEVMLENESSLEQTINFKTLDITSVQLIISPQEI